MRGAVAPQSVGHEAARQTATPLEQLAEEPHGGVAISAPLEQNVDDLAIVIDGQPQVPALTADRYEQFV